MQGSPASMSPRSSPKPDFSQAIPQSHFQHQAGPHSEYSAPPHTTLGRQQRQQRQPSPQQQPPPQQQPQPQQRQPSPQPPPAQKSPEEKAFDIINGVVNEVKTLETEVNSFNGVKSDKGYKYLEEMLTRSLLKLDGVESGSLDNVRTARKQAVKLINAALDLLELKAVAAATNVPSEGSSSSGSSNTNNSNSQPINTQQTSHGGNPVRVKEMQLDSEIPC